MNEVPVQRPGLRQAKKLSTVPENGNVIITIYNVTGQEVEKLVNGVQSAGSYQVVWNASNLSSGIYFYKLNFEGTNRIYSDIKSMILLK